MASAEYLKNKSGETFYPVVNVSSVIFSNGKTYSQYKSEISDMIYDVAYKADNYINKSFIPYQTSAKTNFQKFHIHNSAEVTTKPVDDSTSVPVIPDILIETGVHGIRYYNDKLQLTLNGEWRDVANSEDSFKPAKVSKFKVNYGHKVVYYSPNSVGEVYSELNWCDPDDVSQSVKWAGTKVYRICHRIDSSYTHFESFSEVVQYTKSLGSKILEDEYYKDYTVLLVDNRIKDKYSKTKLIDSTLGSFLMTYVDKLGGKTLTDDAKNEVVSFTNNNSGFFLVFYLCVPYSEDGFDGTPTLFCYNPLTNNIIGGSYSVSRYCDFLNNETYWTGNSYCASPTTKSDLAYWTNTYHSYVDDFLATRYRCIVDQDGYILGFFTQGWNSDFSRMEGQALTIQNAEAIPSFYPEIYYDQWLPEDTIITGNNESDEAIHNFIGTDTTPLGPDTSQNLSWLQGQIDKFKDYPSWMNANGVFKQSVSNNGKTFSILNIPSNSTMTVSAELKVDNSFMSVTVPSTLKDGVKVYKWYYDEAETGEYKWKSKSKTYSAGTVIPIDIMVICPLKFYKETIISQGVQSGAIFKAVYSLSNYYEAGYKPHPAFVYERNPSATSIDQSKPTLTPYILTSAFPCTVFTGNPIDPVAGAKSEPYYKSSSTSPIGDTVTGWDTDTWKTNSASWSIRSIPNTPVSVMADPNRIEDLANKKSTDIKWRCIGYAQFALTEMMMLIEYGTTSVKNLLTNQPDPNVYCNQATNNYAVGTKFDPILWSFPSSLPQGFLMPETMSNSMSPEDLVSSDYELATNKSRVSINFDNSFNNTGYDWHNYRKPCYIFSSTSTSSARMVYSKTSSHTIPGSTWAMGSFSGFLATLDTFTIAGNAKPSSETVSCFVDSSDSNVDCSNFTGFFWNDAGRLDTSANYVVGSYYSPEETEISCTLVTTMSKADHGQTMTCSTRFNSSSVSLTGHKEYLSSMLTPVFTYAGEENFGWGNYTPFNSDTSVINHSVYRGYNYDRNKSAFVSTSYPITAFEIDESDPSCDDLIYSGYLTWGLIAGFDDYSYYEYSSDDSSLTAYQTLGYFIPKLPTQNQYGKFGWCINHVGLSVCHPESTLQDNIGNSNSILGVTMNSRDVKFNSTTPTKSLAACGYDGLAMGIVAHSQSAAIDYSTYTVPYTASTDVTSTAELGNYQPRIYTYAQ